MVFFFSLIKRGRRIFISVSQHLTGRSGGRVKLEKQNFRVVVLTCGLNYFKYLLIRRKPTNTKYSIIIKTMAIFFKQICVIYCLFILTCEKFVAAEVITGAQCDEGRLNKCCPSDKIFNLTSRVCESGEVTFSSRETFFSCTEVIVEIDDPNLSSLKKFVPDLCAKNYCIDGDGEGKWILRKCAPKSACIHLPCIRKCCQDGEKYENGAHCTPHQGSLKPHFHKMGDSHPLKIEVHQFGILQQQNCKSYILDPLVIDDDVHHFSFQDGGLFLAGKSEPLSNDQYCVEVLDSGGQLSLETFVCFDEVNPVKSHPFALYGIGMAISAAFFAFTVLVYVSLPKLMNLHGKTLVANCLSFCIAYTTLAINSFRTEYVSEYFCPIYAYIIYYSLMSGFLWLNVMCFDIWWTFGSIQTSRMKSRETKRFCYYCTYACSTPLIVTSLMLIMQYGGFGGTWRPVLGEEKCWFTSKLFLAFFIAKSMKQGICPSVCLSQDSDFFSQIFFCVFGGIRGYSRSA